MPRPQVSKYFAMVSGARKSQIDRFEQRIRHAAQRRYDDDAQPVAVLVQHESGDLLNTLRRRHGGAAKLVHVNGTFGTHEAKESM